METEERYLRVLVKAPMDYLLDNGRYSDTDPIWDDVFNEIDKVLKSHFKDEPVETLCEEWE